MTKNSRVEGGREQRKTEREQKTHRESDRPYHHFMIVTYKRKLHAEDSPGFKDFAARSKTVRLIRLVRRLYWDNHRIERHGPNSSTCSLSIPWRL
jgi:hypothetical protein